MSTAATPAAIPLHQQQDAVVVVRQEGYPQNRVPKNSDTSSDNSGKHRFTGLELETEQSWAEQSWMRRIRWFRNTRTHRDAGSPPTRTDEIPYVGGTMESAPPIPARDGVVVESNHNDPKAAAQMNTFTRIASWMTANSSQQHDEESVQDFQESEWTPPDSSYGAAIPLFGWIPKKTRQRVEFTIMLVLVVLLVYLMVMLSIMITEARQHDSLAEDNGSLNLDDDRYIGYDDKNNKNDDDPYWSSNNNNNNWSSYDNSNNNNGYYGG